MNDFITFKKFPDLNQAQDLKQFLEENNIKCFLADNMSSIDSNFAGTAFKDYEVKISFSDFKTADSLVQERAENMLHGIDADYYLFSFTNDELYDILLKQDEWSEFDFLLAKKILADRGKTIDEDLIESFKKQRLVNLSKPEPNQKAWVIAGYVFSILGGLIAILIGYMLWTSKKRLPNQTAVYSYTKNARKHGKIIFYLGIFSFIISFSIRFFSTILNI